MSTPSPSAVVDLAAFAAGVAGTGLFLDAEGEGELAAAEAAGIADRLVLRHGTPRGARTGRRVVAGGEQLRALERWATVCDPVEVLLHVALPGGGTGAGFDPYRPAFLTAVRTVVASARLRFTGLYVRCVGDLPALAHACRRGIEMAAVLQQLGLPVGTLFLRRDGVSGAPVDAASLAAAVRREARLHSAALGSLAPHVRVDAGPDSAPPCHVLVHRVIETSARGVVLDLAADVAADLLLAGSARVLSRHSRARTSTRELTSPAGVVVGSVRVPADVRPGDLMGLPVLGRTALASPNRYRLLSTTGVELLAGLGGPAAGRRPGPRVVHRTAS